MAYYRYRDEIPDFLFLTTLSKIRNFVSISSLTGECAAAKFKNFCSSSLWTFLHHMVILRSQNYKTDFVMIFAWACPFNRTSKTVQSFRKK